VYLGELGGRRGNGGLVGSWIDRVSDLLGCDSAARPAIVGRADVLVAAVPYSPPAAGGHRRGSPCSCCVRSAAPDRDEHRGRARRRLRQAPAARPDERPVRVGVRGRAQAGVDIDGGRCRRRRPVRQPVGRGAGAGPRGGHGAGRDREGLGGGRSAGRADACRSV